ncbi:hypothetical protein DFJ66_0151 [Saccharothrix variisporea]|uniref:Uncharacterized protein n=1 Tax=Saccharothrix variisporea TaxID=543527 RepID=A0A495X137_9PSEU|nr:hypothetical protein DFJ66_0151 [Saccharothrix variisporea]
MTGNVPPGTYVSTLRVVAKTVSDKIVTSVDR